MTLAERVASKLKNNHEAFRAEDGPHLVELCRGEGIATVECAAVFTSCLFDQARPVLTIHPLSGWRMGECGTPRIRLNIKLADGSSIVVERDRWELGIGEHAPFLTQTDACAHQFISWDDGGAREEEICSVFTGGEKAKT
uniref:Uncharacterized protein n=1 Tax=Desulfacinum infernum TaxID=35837 RepID=A0A831ZIH1_9BACT